MLQRLPKWQRVFIVGIFAGSLATIVQLILWWAMALPLPETLYRDTRLTAAIVMGPGIITPDQLMQAPGLLALLLAGVIHFFLSIIYAGLYAWLPIRSRNLALACFNGAIFGLLIYALNMYGFTTIFPWFAMVRDFYTIAAHIVFGLLITLGVRATDK